MYCQI